MTAVDAIDPSRAATDRKSNPAPNQRRAPAASRTPVERLLPRSLIVTLKHHVSSGAEVSAKLARELDERFGIAATYGVSAWRLRAFLKRSRQADRSKPSSPEAAKTTSRAEAPECVETPDGAKPPTPTDAPERAQAPECAKEPECAEGPECADPQGGTTTQEDAEAVESNDDWQRKLREHRRRQASVAAILDATFGRFAESHPKLWEQRAYLMLVGLVYEQLVQGTDELNTKDLLTLARVLESSRRGRTDRHADDGSANGRAKARTDGGHLPKRFADVVRQVYGTNFQQTP